MRIRFLALLPKLAVISFALSGCLSTDYKVMGKTQKGEPIKRNEAIELGNSTVGISFGKDYRHDNSQYYVYLGFVNVDSKDDLLKITQISAGIEHLNHPKRIYALSNVYWNKFVNSGVGDRMVFIDSIAKNPVPFIVPFSPSNSIKMGTYYDYDHYSYVYAFRNGPKRKRLRKVKVNVTVSYEWKDKIETVTRSFLFERFHYFLWN